MNTRFETLYIN